MSETAACVIEVVRGGIHGALLAYFLVKKKWLGVAAVIALVLLEFVLLEVVR